MDSLKVDSKYKTRWGNIVIINQENKPSLSDISELWLGFDNEDLCIMHWLTDHQLIIGWEWHKETWKCIMLNTWWLYWEQLESIIRSFDIAEKVNDILK
jgi:hypothetical protein